MLECWISVWYHYTGQMEKRMFYKRPKITR
nr:MAG TPA: hypothetical protein [Caudoviricetes sp.]